MDKNTSGGGKLNYYYTLQLYRANFSATSGVFLSFSCEDVNVIALLPKLIAVKACLEII